ncbi:DUF2442 domain-containing protein [Clostridium tyrobutyricum]|jgi:hypothetical protein|uniref:DUF2442 domain-containing protein n=2 Tax=Clostridium tyrobutyricum TaxID=1519 RepID=UPI0020CAB1B7|nr:DUF2442 domain-containing protein [Clostridium tyrobutyricum]
MEKKIFDMKPYLKYPIFKPLNNLEEFKKFSIVDGTIEWMCGAELSSDTFYLASRQVNKDELKEMSKLTSSKDGGV